jgi:DNA repair protein RadC
LKALEDKYDIDILIKKKSVSKKEKFLHFLKITEIATQNLRKQKALAKTEQRLSKFQAIIRGFIVRKRYHLYLKQQRSIVKIQSLFRGKLTRNKLEK